MLFLLRENEQPSSQAHGRARFRTASAITGMIRQEKNMSDIKRVRWTEADVLALPAGEHHYFDRKSGALIGSPEFRKDMARALSAFANSGGGYLILGMADDGTFDGVPPAFKGSTPTREWLEQIISRLLDYPLEDFRVHAVEPAKPSAIPSGTVAIVVDVGDSVLAPHQAAGAVQYYYRVGGHSTPAPHFYLETLRNRLTNPILKPELQGVRVARAYACEGGAFVELILRFEVKNTGRVAAYKWRLVLDRVTGARQGDDPECFFDARQFPRTGGGVRRNGVLLDDTILPSLSVLVERDLGLVQRRNVRGANPITLPLLELLASGLTVHYRAVTETSPGEAVSRNISPLVNQAEAVRAIEASLSAEAQSR